LLVSALVAGVVGGAATVAVWHWVDDSESSRAGAGSCAVDRVADQVLPSVVTIHAGGLAGSGTGSGVVVRAGGGEYVVTNDHVIAPAHSSGNVTVTYFDGRSSPATIVGADPLTDLAVVRVDDPSPDAQDVRIGDSAALRVGQPVVALGAPLGLSSTVTSGIVSAMDRYVRVPAGQGLTAHLVGAIQTDAAINPGNSGGALVDCDGQLVGINTAGASPAGESGSVGLGFAIPVSLVQKLAEELISSGRVVHPTFGLQVVPISPSLAAQADRSPGLLVRAVDAGGPGDQAGLRVGDIVTRIDGAPMRNFDDLVSAELQAGIGDSLEVGYDRDGEESTTTLVTQAAK
jgi:putative serine protease PepD